MTTFIYVTKDTIDKVLGNEKMADINYEPPEDEKKHETKPLVVQGKVVSVRKIETLYDILYNIMDIIPHLREKAKQSKKIRDLEAYVHDEIEEYEKANSGNENYVSPYENEKFLKHYKRIMKIEFGETVELIPRNDKIADLFGQKKLKEQKWFQQRIKEINSQRGDIKKRKRDKKNNYEE